MLPDLVVLSRKHTKTPLAPAFKDAITRDAMAPFREIQLVPAELGENCSPIGAVSLASSIAENRS